MVTCARLAPACIDISPMAPPINSDFIIALTSATTRATTTITKSTTTKPKLAFTIDALVGDKTTDTPPKEKQCTLKILKPISPVGSSESRILNCRSNTPSNEILCNVVGNSPTPSSECCRSCQSSEVQDAPREKPSTIISQNPQNLPTGPIRPLPMQLMTNSLPQNATLNLPHSIASASTATTISTGVPTPLPPPTHSAQPHFLTAQFQMAAALAHQQQQQHLSSVHLPPGHPMTLFSHMSPNPHPHMLGATPFIRESYPLYPWFLSRHGRIFPHRFPGNFLLQPFRKPKRVRTAFSPTQLLKLEHAFEGNHYVVGAERKQLAQGLSLTETQVKVWFQNRRTKHKRMQQEGGESDTKSNKDSQSDDIDAKNNDNRSENSFEDYENVMTVDDDDDDEGDDVEEGNDEQHADEFDGQDEIIDMNEYGSDLDAVEQKKMHEQFQQQFKHQPILLQQQYMHKDNQQQQINLQQLSQQQFINHQLHLQQQKQPHQVQHEQS